jgi:hypothetical protein
MVMADNLFSFSYYYNNSQKISQAKELTEILKEQSLTKYEKEKLLKLRRDIIEHSTWKDHAWSFFTSISFSKDAKSTTTKGNTTKSIIERSYNWHFVTSSWILILMMIFTPIALLFDKTTPSSVGENLWILFITEPMYLGFAWLLAKAFSYIPVIYGNPIFNYILNALICAAISLIIFLYIKYESDKESKKSKEENERIS